MTHKLSFQTYDKNLMAYVRSDNMPISLKVSVDIFHFIKGKKVDYVLKYFDDVIALKKPMPFVIYRRETSHKSGMMAGRYPVKAIKHIKIMLESAKKNALDKGFSNDLIVIHAVAMKGNNISRYGRNYGRSQKATHVEIVVMESSSKDSKNSKNSDSKQKKQKQEPLQKQESAKSKEKDSKKPSAKNSDNDVDLKNQVDKK